MIACSIGKSSLTISAKPVGVGTASQPWILTGERSLLLTRIAEALATPGISVEAFIEAR